jgi:hypothetical protein
MTLHRQPEQPKPPPAKDVIACPSCGSDRLRPHCGYTDRRTPCGWVLCGVCRSYGIPGKRWCDMRRRPAA